MTAPARVSERCRRVGDVLRLLGDKWTIMIVMVLVQQPRRFNEIRCTVGEISQQMQTRTLKALERDGMVTWTVHCTVPPQVEYALTTLGQSLARSAREFGQWADTHRGKIDSNRERFDAAKS